MRNDLSKIYIIELFAIFFTLLNFFIFKLNYVWLVVVFTFFTLLAFLIIGNKKVKFINAIEVRLLMIAFGIVYLILFYLLGIYFGFYRSVVTVSFNSLFRYLVPIIIIIVETELLKNLFFSRKNKISYVLGTVLFVMIDINLNKSITVDYNLSSLLNFFGYVVLTSISSNLLYNYICINFGYESNIVFRILTTCYIYVIPFVPNVYMFIRIFLKMFSHFLIYIILYNLYYKKYHRFEKTNLFEKLLWSISFCFVIIFCVLVSCKFKYGMLVVGSGSMTGTINKGDAVIFEKYKSQNLDVGDIVVFQRNNMVVIHRIINIDGDGTRIYTKGDFNVQEDDGYASDKDIIGIVRFKIHYFGIPSLLLKELVG